MTNEIHAIPETHQRKIPLPFDEVRLYILVRNDLKSLSPGKAAAQAPQAANHCVFELRKKISNRLGWMAGSPHFTDHENYLHNMLKQWEGDRGFGTCIVLAATPEEIKKIMQQANYVGYHANITHDPSYPLRDGKFMHQIPLDTCAYVFGVKSELEPFLCHLSLM